MRFAVQRGRPSGPVKDVCGAGKFALMYAIPFTSLEYRYSAVPTRSQGSRWSIARLLRQIWGNLKLGSVSASWKLAAGAPVTVAGLYASGFVLNGYAVVLSAWIKPVS